jgi:hypothetical protein
VKGTVTSRYVHIYEDHLEVGAVLQIWDSDARAVVDKPWVAGTYGVKFGKASAKISDDSDGLLTFL